jgi:8-oxo-dGTP pyrophosphatase MutT (NUDIX family)
MIEPAIVTAIHARLASALAPPRGRYLPLRIGCDIAGWLDAERAERIAAFADVFEVGADGIAFAPGHDDPETRTAAFDRVARTLSAEGALTTWRDERYAVAAEFGAPPWFLLERAAARYFGIQTFAAHVNGLVRRGGDILMWLARRSPVKAIDPGMLDNMVGGGIAAGMTIAGTVVKETWEEAGLAAPVARRALLAGTVEILRERPDGLQHETIHVHDLWLDSEVTPAGQDGEVVGHRLVYLVEAARLIANETGPDVATADSSLVIVDCLLRLGTIAPDTPDCAALEALRHPRNGPLARSRADCSHIDSSSPRTWGRRA